MKNFFSIVLTVFTFSNLYSQSIYFPPLTGNEWETTDPHGLNFCDEKITELYNFLEEKNTKAFLLLKDGKIVLEQYFNGFGPDSLWYWASAGKSVTATLVGIAQDEGLLNINDKSSDYLGLGWTSAPQEKEDLITVRHQLTMTSGLDDGTGDVDCTDPDCLFYLQDAGTRWAYHNAPYTKLDGVLENASGENFNAFYWNRLANKTGMGGLWVYLGYNHVLFSKARAMARFGLLMQNNGYWNNTPVLADADYLNDMINTSQDLNKAYGYLWWLNGKESYKLPGLQIDFPGPLCPDAPADMFAAMGKNGQFLNISPSQGLVLVRMGESPDGLLVPNLLNNEIWQYVNDLECEPNATLELESADVKIFPNPINDYLNIEWQDGFSEFNIRIFNALGKEVMNAENENKIDLTHLNKGVYFYNILINGKNIGGNFIKN
ncbi:MAG: serine hydrolase [Saprospiraceae bacterium]